MTDQKTLKRIINEQRSEIHQLKETKKLLYDAHQKAIDELERKDKQIETAKQRLEEEKEFLVYRTPLVQDLKKILGEKTEP